jgi:hypothetical protein
MFRQTATALGMRFQKVRIHGNPPLNNAVNLAWPIRLIYGLRKGLVKLWIKETTTILVRVGLDGLRHRTPPPVVRDADP